LSQHDTHFFTIIPNEQNDVSLFFGFAGFISTGVTQKTLLKNVKVLVWDLDNTMWDGILVEQSEEKPVILKHNIKHILKELDRRGIVNSISSKNDHDKAIDQLTKFGIIEYFVFPEISWDAKSISISKIIKNFNINEDTIAFVDDSKFEREEVLSQLSKVRVIDALEYQDILNRDDFNPKVSRESSNRRKFYKNQSVRDDASQLYGGKYLDFIRSCDIQLKINLGNEENLDRIHELVQRTNQMNYSGNRYTKTELSSIIKDEKFISFQIKCIDKYGDYGTVGFCIFDVINLCVVDLAFSCRVQSKRVEHAFISWLFNRYKNDEREEFKVVYKQTDRNKQSGQVFKDLNFIKHDEQTYSYSLSSNLLDEGIIDIVCETGDVCINL
jgi:FkbH-like protein